jgi:hypothetical protein
MARFTQVFGLCAVAALVALAVVGFARTARADLFTEIGGGYVVPSYSSPLEVPTCWTAVPMRNIGTASAPVAAPAHGDPGELYACGGHNPVFIGWPIGWEFPNGARVGVFHTSHWFDGPPFKGDGESSMTCLCATWTHHWRGLRR